MPHPTSSRDFDAIRAEHPEVAFYVYAIVLGGVTLELITPDQQVYRFDGRTLAEALERAFPPEPAATTEPVPVVSAIAPDIFD
jgi:hypothetical protein